MLATVARYIAEDEIRHYKQKLAIDVRCSFFGFGTATPDELRAVSQISY